MPPTGPRPTWHEVVRAHHRETEGLVVARSGRCLEIQADERNLVYGRTFKPLKLEELFRYRFGKSWFAGVLLGPEDTTDDLARWARALPPVALERIHFYYTPRVVLALALAACKEAGLPNLAINEVRNFRTFHRLYGRHHADRVHKDFSKP